MTAETSEVLLKLSQKVKSTEDCGDEPQEYLDEDMICAQNPTNPDETTCKGDSGGR